MTTRKRVRHRATHDRAAASIVDIQARLRGLEELPLPPADVVTSEDEASHAATEPETTVDLEALVASAEADLDHFLHPPVFDPPAVDPVVEPGAEARLAAIDARLAELESELEEFFTRLEPAARRRVVNSDRAADASVADLQRAIDKRLVKRRAWSR
jgi:hypothetical protein